MVFVAESAACLSMCLYLHIRTHYRSLLGTDEYTEMKQELREMAMRALTIWPSATLCRHNYFKIY